MSLRDLDILLVEDNPGDVRLTFEALRERRFQHRLHVAEDGERALSFLYKQDEHFNVPTPDLVLLDLNLPKKSGFEVLSVLKSDPALKVIPVVMLTTSNSESDIINCYKQHVNCYVTKPVSFQDFVNAIHRIEEFWLSVVALPGNAS